MSVTYPTLEHVAMEARPYPTHLLEGCETGLCLFAAAFLGHNDAVHFAEAGIQRVWCIDTDVDRLREMEAIYPDEWFFIEEDAWRYARQAHEDMTSVGWDVVSVDTFTGDVMERSLDSLRLWCAIARKVVTVTITEDAIGRHVGRWVDGWSSSLHTRATGVYWLVLTRD